MTVGCDGSTWKERADVTWDGKLERTGPESADEGLGFRRVNLIAC